MTSKKKFSFCVGRPWPNQTNQDNICVYSYHNEIRFGTLEDAKSFKKYVEENTNEKNSIYRLIKLND